MRNGVIAGLLALFAGSGVAAGNRLYRAGDFVGAEARYREALAEGDTAVEARYNLGTALLRQRRWDDARRELEAAAARVADRPGARETALRAHYNAGNADLEPAWADSSDRDLRQARARRAVARYRRALLADPDDADAKWNLELALRLLEGSGGGGDDETPDDGGSDGPPENPQPASPQSNPAPADGGDASVTRAEAERILGAAERQERDLQRARLRRNGGGTRTARDW